MLGVSSSFGNSFQPFQQRYEPPVPAESRIPSLFDLNFQLPQTYSNQNEWGCYYWPREPSQFHVEWLPLPPQNSPFQFSSNEGVEEEADWFDFGDENFPDDNNSTNTTKRRFEWYPVPAEPVVPIERLTIAIMEDHEFYCDDQDYIQVYTDGSYRRRLGNSFSAIGVWFGPNHKLNVSQPTQLGGFNSDGAEFEAIIEAIKIACACGVEKVQINTDSQNAIRFLIHFIKKWEANGWRNVRGRPVRNQNLIRQLDQYCRMVTVKWNYVPSRAGVQGNVEADRLARRASAVSADSRLRNITNSRLRNTTNKRISRSRCRVREKLRNLVQCYKKNNSLPLAATYCLVDLTVESD